MSSGTPTRREQYIEAMKRNLAAELADPPLMLCPKCGGGWVLPDTAAGRMGVCAPCWHKARAEACRLAAREIKAQCEDDAARAEKSRATRKAKGAR